MRGTWLAVVLGVFVAVANGHAFADSCHPAVDHQKPQYTIGYGSLMQKASKDRTAPNTGGNIPAMVTGYQRAWNAQGVSIGFSTTYLGVTNSPDARMAAAFYQIFDASDIEATDQREVYYCREAVKPAQVRLLDRSVTPASGQIWIYVNKPEYTREPDKTYPMVQSYVDILISGCIELRARVIGENQDFAEQCIETTDGWSPHWVNDRLYPRRPFMYQPSAGKIDKLLADMVPEQFNSIKIE